MNHVNYRTAKCKFNFIKLIGLNKMVIMMVSILIFISSTSLSAKQGPVVWLRATNSLKKEVLRDLSGNNNNIVLHGALLVNDVLCGKALKFDGIDDYVDCGTSKLFNVSKGLTMEVWVKPSGEQTAGLPGIIGKSYPSYAMIYTGSYLKFQTGGNQLRVSLQPNIWQHICCVHGDSDIIVYVNGKEIVRLPKKQQLISRKASDPLRLGKIGGDFRYTQDAFFKGRIAMARVYDRALSSKEVEKNFDNSSVSVFNKAIFDIAAYCWVPDNQVIIKFSPFKQLPEDTVISITIAGDRFKSVKQYKQNINLFPAATLDLTSIKPGDYTISVIASNAKGNPIAPPVITTLKWPGMTNTKTAGTRLNNFVRQLAVGNVQDKKRYKFSNPHEGWVYIAVSKGTLPKAIIQGDKINATYKLEKIQGGLRETMRYLPAGEYSVYFTGAEGTFAVRAIPFIMMTEYNDDRPYINMSKKEELEFRDVHNIVQENFARHHLKNPMDTEKPNPMAIRRMKLWTKRGRFNITNSPITGISTRQNKKNIPPVEKSFEFWSNAYAMKCQNGIILDEFGGGKRGEHKYWAEAFRKISKNNQADIYRKIFAYCTKDWYSSKEAAQVLQVIIECNYMFAPEIYLAEKPDEADAKIECINQLVRSLNQWKKHGFPLRQIVMTLSNSVGGAGCSNDRFPWVDYKVFYEMQIRSLALDPRLDGLGGITAWINRYSDEETLRWIGKLYRHYCIEGKTSPLYISKGYSYRLDYVHNSEFMEGLKHWEIHPAQKGSIYLQCIPWYGTNRGMHNYTFVQGAGDTFVVMRTISNKANKLSQQITGLVPGKTYCARIISGDYTALKKNKVKKKFLPVSIIIKGGKIISDKCNIQNSLALRGVKMPSPIKVKKPLINYHMVVFKALQGKAELIITDRFEDGSTDLKEGDEVLVNFIEIQPYFDK